MQWISYGALSQLVTRARAGDSWLRTNLVETAGCASVIARDWLRRYCCERVEFTAMSIRT